jgi:hypothetical protein
VSLEGRGAIYRTIQWLDCGAFIHRGAVFLISAASAPRAVNLEELHEGRVYTQAKEKQRI